MGEAAKKYTPQQLEIMHKLRTDYRFFAKNCLKIKTDEGIKSFVFNEAQEYIHYRAEKQLREKGWVRLIGVKARQQGFSEYVSGRGYKYATQNRAKTVYILSHEAQSTGVLFGKVDRYHRYCQDAMKPKEVTANRNQKKFDNESEYTVGTAGSENTGRSNTVQFGHLSEPAHYDNDEGIKSGLLQAISDAPGTEIWWESTANGKNWFYKFVMETLEGKTEYEVVFIPWFWTWRYRSPAPPDFKRTDEEQALAETGTWFNPATQEIEKRELDNDQLYWRRKKIALLGGRLMKQEFPATLQEAFQASGNSFIGSELVEKARQTRIDNPYGANVLGVDPGRTGDRTVLAKRKGRKIYPLEKHKTMDSMRLAGIISNRIDAEDIDKNFTDWGMGHGTIDRLHERGYRMVVEGINFGGTPDDERFYNKRAEMIFAFRDWLLEGDVELPDDDDMAADIAMIPEPELTSNGKIKFPSKEDIRKEYKRSPDIVDAIVLTFAYPVRPKEVDESVRFRSESEKRGGVTRTMRRVRRNEDEDNSIDWGPPKVRSKG